MFGAAIRRAVGESGLLSARGPDLASRGTYPPKGAPAARTQAGEILTGLQFGRLLAGTPRLLLAPRGDGSSVIDLPGWRAGSQSVAPLRTYLRWLGYNGLAWGLGRNIGHPARAIDSLGARVAAIAEADGRPVSLVGWSLGGLIAREIARNDPERVRCVVTFGTPVLGGPTHTATARFFGAEECRRIEMIGQRMEDGRPIEVPLTAIYSRRDGIVSWRACIDTRSPRAENIEVGSTHLGMGVDPDVWEIVARALAASAGGWV